MPNNRIQLKQKAGGVFRLIGKPFSAFCSADSWRYLLNGTGTDFMAQNEKDIAAILVSKGEAIFQAPPSIIKFT